MSYTTQNYKIIQDEIKLKEFIEWLPELQDGECYYLSLMARKKYCSLLTSDKTQIKRFTSNKERLYDKIKQLQVELGSYKQDSMEIPESALALYISPNPRSYTKAAKQSAKKFIDYLADNKVHFNAHAEVLSQIQIAKSRSIFIDWDFDNDKEILDEAEYVITDGNFINKEAISILKTRGGFHLLIEMSKIDESIKKSWFNNITKLHKKYSKDIDNHGDNLIPVPGCIQSNYVPILTTYLK